MEEEDSQTRFTALVSGTAADQLPKGSYINPHKHRVTDARVQEVLSNVRIGQQQSRALLGVGSGGSVGGVSLAAPGDLIRRNYRDTQRGSFIDTARFSSPTIQADGGRRDEDFPPHTPGEGLSAGSRNVQPRELVKLRTSKSLHQRSETDGSRGEQHGFGHHAAGSQRQAAYDALPSTHSRSASVASFGNPAQDEDIPSIMMRGANDLRNAKYEIEELRRELSFLKSQLDSTKSEKVELMQRVKSVKEATRKGLESTSRSLEGMRITMEGLKVQSDETFAFFVQAKAALPDVKELRDTVSESIKGLEAVLDEDGHLVEVSKTKEILTELKLQCTGSRQVAEMLREKLQSVGSDLIDAKTRVTELENGQAADREALRLSNARLSEANEQIQKFADALRRQQTELHDALIACADLESQIAEASERTKQLNQLVQRRDSELEILAEVRSEGRRLELLLGERDVQVAELKALQESFDSMTSCSTEQIAQIQSLETTIQAKDEALAHLQTRISNKESQLLEAQGALQVLQQELSSTAAHVESLRSDVARKVEEIQSLETKLEESRVEFQMCESESDQRRGRIHELEAKYQVMEERYETQLVTTKCAQDTQAELQERLIETEKKSTYDLEASTGKRNVEIAVLEQQTVALQAKVNDLEAAAQSREEDIVAIKADYGVRMAKQDDSNRVQLELAERRVSDVQSALDDARASLRSLEEQIASAKQEMLDLRDELREARLPDPGHKEAVDALTAQITALRLENTELVLRARSIDARYRTGDLNEEEKIFINTLVQTSQSIHEQELVFKGNELIRRENTIRELQARIQVFEVAQAKHLKAMSRPIAVAIATAENRSLIDPTAWVASSDKSKSPPQPAEEDITSTNVDNTVTAKPTPAPVRPMSRPLLAVVPQPDPNTKARATRTPARLRPDAPTGAPTTKSSPAQPKKLSPPAGMPPLSSSPLVYPQPKTPAIRGPGGAAQRAAVNANNAGPKTNFRRLDTAMSDDIQDFEDKSRKASPIGTPPEANAAEPAQAGKTGLGKRGKPSDAVSPPGGGKYAKRLRTGMRSRAAGQHDEPTLKSVDSTQAKPKMRKRRG